MGYALKLSNVNFSNVAVDTVSYIETIPCTGLTLSVNALSFDRAEETKTVIATKTPSNTTDELFWVSSDENVATVTNGEVTIHGIGTATITAICGDVSASVQIAQTTIKAQYDFAKITGHYPKKNTAGDKYVIGTTSSSANNVVGQAKHAENTDLRIMTSLDIEAIRVPYGATQMYFAAVEGTNPQAQLSAFGNTNSLVSVDGTYYPEFIKIVNAIWAQTGIAVEYGQCFVLRVLNEELPNIGDYAYFT